MKKIIEFLPYIIAGYETLSHVIPTKKNYSLFNKIGFVLQLVSSLLNRNKPYKNSDRGLPIIIFLSFCFAAITSCSTLKRIECISAKSIPVVFITDKGEAFRVNVPFCDTVRIKSINQLPDTLKLK